MNNAILQFSDVKIIYPNGFCAVRNANFSLDAGECFGLVGESGSGKTTIAKAALGILPNGTAVSGSIRIKDIEIVGASEKTLRSLRGRVVGFVAQEPFSAFNPLARVLDHVREAWRVHALKADENEIFRALEKIGIQNAVQTARKFPHEWSGGMLQRAGIVAATAHNPALIIADEPTSALDADRADSILKTLRATGTALLLVSHDINLVRRFTDRIAVCYQGEIVEIGKTEQIFNAPQHEYTKFLLAANEKKAFIEKPSVSETVLEAKNLSKIYGRGDSAVCAVSKADLTVRSGEIVGICGASGSGKSTLLRLLATIEMPTNGKVYLENELATCGASKKLLSEKARKGFVMPVFQDPLGSLDKNWAIWRIVTEPLTAKHRKEKFSKAARREIAREILAKVNLNEIDLDAKPRQLSIGQCQRVSIARALTANPKLIVADEPTASLDASVAQTVMKLLCRIAEQGTAIVVVSHDEPLLKSYCRRVLHMRDGVLENSEV
jgi:ATPase components of various ABC-type transport systems, contain duplicated ATPase